MKERDFRLTLAFIFAFSGMTASCRVNEGYNQPPKPAVAAPANTPEAQPSKPTEEPVPQLKRDKLSTEDRMRGIIEVDARRTLVRPFGPSGQGQNFQELMSQYGYTISHLLFWEEPIRGIPRGEALKERSFPTTDEEIASALQIRLILGQLPPQEEVSYITTIDVARPDLSQRFGFIYPPIVVEGDPSKDPSPLIMMLPDRKIVRVSTYILLGEKRGDSPWEWFVDPRPPQTSLLTNQVP